MWGAGAPNPLIEAGLGGGRAAAAGGGERRRRAAGDGETPDVLQLSCSFHWGGVEREGGWVGKACGGAEREGLCGMWTVWWGADHYRRS